MTTALDVPRCDVSRAQDAPERLTVLGVDGRDRRLLAELGRFVPDTADAIYRLPSPQPVTSATTAGAALKNPPAVTGSLLLRGWAHVRGPSAAATAVDGIGDEQGIQTEILSAPPLIGVREQGPLWTLGAWLATIAAVGSLLAAVLLPHLVTGLFVVVGVGLYVAFALAHAGASIRFRDDAIAEAALAHARECGHEHPVVVVPERHGPGIADLAKDAGVPTDLQSVSTDLVVEESLR